MQNKVGDKWEGKRLLIILGNLKRYQTKINVGSWKVRLPNNPSLIS